MEYEGARLSYAELNREAERPGDGTSVSVGAPAVQTTTRQSLDTCAAGTKPSGAGERRKSRLFANVFIFALQFVPSQVHQTRFRL
ncbi:MAG TPA: hypothetical protein VE093_14655 [Polyangiaceae bacterium]|nr:hypothetical protein [Polyangiaceae bacterium]